MGGLYSWINDGVKFFDQKGGDDAFEHEFSSPYDGRGGRGPTLAKVLVRWRELAERGVWRVGVDGVMEDEGWWVENLGSGDLKLGW